MDLIKTTLSPSLPLSLSPSLPLSYFYNRFSQNDLAFQTFQVQHELHAT